MKNNQSAYISLASHPFSTCTDGTRDLVIRHKSSPSTVIVPLFDNHDYDRNTIGSAKLTFIPIAEISKDTHICIVTALITTNMELSLGHSVSIGAPLVEKRKNLHIYNDIAELSIVDVGHLPHACITNGNMLISLLNTFSTMAPNFLPNVVKELHA